MHRNLFTLQNNIPVSYITFYYLFRVFTFHSRKRRKHIFCFITKEEK